MIGQTIERWVMRGLLPFSVRHVRPMANPPSDGLSRRVYDQMARDFQIVPPFVLHAADAEVLAGVWTLFREAALAGPVSRVDREAVAVAVSRYNRCSFCVDAHTMMLHGKAAHGLVWRLLNPDAAADADTRAARLVRWAGGVCERLDARVEPEVFSAAEAPFLLGTAVAFQFINRMVSVFLTDSVLPLPAPLRPLRGVLNRLNGAWMGRRIMNLTIVPGESLELLADGPEIAEFRFAAADANVAAALRRFARVMEQAGNEAVPPSAREQVRRRVESWNCRADSARPVDLEFAGLPAAGRASARLAALAALYPRQVDRSTVADFRRHFPTDQQLVRTAAWGSYLATRRIAGWLSATLEGEPAAAAAGACASD